MSRPFLALLCLLPLVTVVPTASAQSAPPAGQQAQIPADATLAAIRFEGVSDPSTESLMQVRLISRPGVRVSDIDLPAERNRILNSGTFSEVSLSVENRPVGAVLFVRVKENPPIREVVLRGITVVDAKQMRQILLQENLVGAGQIYNTTRAQEAISTLQSIYNDPRLSFPGQIPVTLTVRPVAQKGRKQAGVVTLANAAAVRLVYAVNETPAIDTVTFSGETVVPEDELNTIFRSVASAETFSLSAYQTALQGVADAYSKLGFRGSGVDQTATNLTDGTLNVVLNELQILSLDTAAIGIDPSAFSLQPGDLYNYDTLLTDVNKLAQGRSEDIRLETQPIGGGVAVVFKSGAPASAGPIKRIDVEGNTVFSDAELKLQLELKKGETFTSALATEDFQRLVEFYAQEGYLLVQEPRFNFREGTYSQRLREVKIAGYQIDLQTDNPRTKDRVITRYLPKVGGVYNQPEVERGILQLNALQIVRLGQIGARISHALVPTNNPARYIVRFIAQEVPSRTITPSAELSTEGGVSFTADVAVADTNLFGLAHNASASVNATTSNLGFLLGGRISYSIPWLDLDFLDFKTVPTSASAEVFSETTSNQPLSSGGNRCVPFGGGDIPAPDPAPDVDANVNNCDLSERALIGEYTQRDTGFRFSVGRPILPNLSASLAARFTQSDYFVEPPDEECNPLAFGSGCSLPYKQAVLYAPQNGFSSFFSSTLAFDVRDNPEFAREGYRVSVGGGVGFGNDFSPNDVQQGYTYEQLEVGASTYVAPFENKSHVFAFRINAGQQFPAEGTYPASRLFVIGNTNNQATQLRGYRSEDINPSQTYLTTTAEYRYDFGLSTAVTQTIVGIGFVDLGYASSVNLAEGTLFAPLLPSVGVALQLNIGFGGGLALPPLRFDYGVSPRNPTGVFGFRLGFNF